MKGQAEESLKQFKKNAKQKIDEILAFKYRGKKPKEFYPDQFLANLKQWNDQDITNYCIEAMMSYERVMLGNRFSFIASDIAEMEKLDVETVQSFLNQLSIGFGEIKPDFSQPEVMHPLKDKPILRHDDRYLCSSLSLLDYSLDRLFTNVLGKDSQKVQKYSLRRHDFLLKEGVELIAKTLCTKEVYTNLTYPGGESDGMIVCDTNVFFIEAKGHRITDRAKRGFIDRVANHLESIVKESHEQGLRSYRYFFGEKGCGV